MSAGRKSRGETFKLRTVLSRFVRESRSVVALEFALLGSAFFFFVLGMVMVAVVQYWQMALDDAVRAVSRSVAIGTITTNTQFGNAVCSQFGQSAPFCSTTLQFYVQSNSYFSTGGTSGISPAVFFSNGPLAPATFNPNQASDPALSPFNLTPTRLAAAAVGASQSATPGSVYMLLVQVAYPLPFTIPWLGGAFTENGTSSLYSVVATAME